MPKGYDPEQKKCTYLCKLSKCANQVTEDEEEEIYNSDDKEEEGEDNSNVD